MKKTLHIFSIKKHCRIQIVFGLCLAMLFTFLCVDYNINASVIQQEWGAFTSDNLPHKMTNPGNNQMFSLLEMIQASWDYREFESLYSWSDFINVLQSYGIYDYLYNWDPYNPQFYVNIYFKKYSSYGSLLNPVLIFTKSNCNYSEMIPEDWYNNLIVNNPINNSPSDLNLIPFSFDLEYYTFLPSYSPNLNSSSQGSKFLSFQIPFNDYPNNATDITGYYYFNDYPVTLYFSGDFSNAFNVFLNDSSSYFFTFNLWSSNGSVFNYVDLAPVHTSDFTEYYIFSSFNVYQSNPIYSLDFIEDISTSQRKRLNYYQYKYSSSDYPLKPIWAFHDQAGSENYYKPIIKAFCYKYDLGHLPTPTPIPTWSWVTPTPFPTYEVHATLTPIAFVNNPTLDVDNGTVFGHLNGVLKLFNQYFYDNPFPKVFGYCADLIYSFSDVFKFFIIVPTIALIAMVIGRLRRK